MAEDEAMIRSVELADEFGRTAKLLGARLASRLSHHELSMPRAQLLAALLRYGPQRISQLGDNVGISQGTASTLADALVRDGLVERRVDTRDRRATELALTASGHDEVLAWLRDYETAADEIFAALSPDERRALMIALRILSADTGS